MDLVVGHDLTAHGDDALIAALILAGAQPDLSIGVVHVLSQVDLDRTGVLSADDKRRAAVERAFPTVWRRIEEVCDARGLESDALELDVQIRVAAVHLVRSQEAIARLLLEVARDHGAPRIALGRTGRPGCVAEHLLAAGTREDPPAGAPAGTFLLALAP